MTATPVHLTSDVAAAWLRAFAAAVEEHAGELTDLDRPIGDSDHGVNLQRGMRAVVAALDTPSDAASDAAPDAAPDAAADTPGAVLGAAGKTLVSTVGGASGPLFGTLLRRAGKSLGETDADLQALAAALRSGLEGIVKLGGAAVGDATLVDALTPAVEALESGAPVAAAVEAAEAGAASTEPLVARKGRASYLGERGVGHRDPGAQSVVLLLRALEEVVS